MFSYIGDFLYEAVHDVIDDVKMIFLIPYIMYVCKKHGTYHNSKLYHAHYRERMDNFLKSLNYDIQADFIPKEMYDDGQNFYPIKQEQYIYSISKGK